MVLGLKPFQLPGQVDQNHAERKATAVVDHVQDPGPSGDIVPAAHPSVDAVPSMAVSQSWNSPMWCSDGTSTPPRA